MVVSPTFYTSGDISRPKVAQIEPVIRWQLVIHFIQVVTLVGRK